MDEFRTDYSYSSGFATVYAVLRNGEIIALTKEVTPSPSNTGMYGGYNGEYKDPNATPDDEIVSNKDIWTKIRKAIISGKPVSLPI